MENTKFVIDDDDDAVYYYGARFVRVWVLDELPLNLVSFKILMRFMCACVYAMVLVRSFFRSVCVCVLVQ